MPRIAPFEAHPHRYEAWFDRHTPAYLSELLAMRAFVPWFGRGLEIGVGSARFAGPLGIAVGVDPSPAMLSLATARGVKAVQGTAESLPFTSASFDFAVIVTTLCFVDSPARMLTEANRVLRDDGRVVIGFIDRNSPMGRDYLAHQDQNVFYREATFYSAGQVERLLNQSGFSVHAWGQTLSRPLPETLDIEPLQPGHGRCAFIVVTGHKR